MNEKTQLVITLTNALDRVTKVHGNDSAEADAIRDAMDKPWQALSDEEQEYVREQISENVGD